MDARFLLKDFERSLEVEIEKFLSKSRDPALFLNHRRDGRGLILAFKPLMTKLKAMKIVFILS